MVRYFNIKSFVSSLIITFITLITLQKILILLSDFNINIERVDLKSSVIDRSKLTKQSSVEDVPIKFLSPKPVSISSAPVAQHTNVYDENNQKLPFAVNLSWNRFVDLDRKKNSLFSSKKPILLSTAFNPIIFCPISIEKNLSKPMLSKADQEWCNWALDSKGGNVVVGQSWGNLVKDNPAKEQFEELNCNAFSKGINPSCDDEWGDNHIKNWRNSAVTQIQCSPKSTSTATCYDNENKDRFCVMENVQINFNMMRDHDRGQGMSKSRVFDKGFMSIDCNSDSDKFLKWTHLFSTQLQPSRSCDYVINGTTFVYSHDDVLNVGHTLNDIMNVWTLMWLTGTSRFSDEITLLNIDAFNLGHNLNDNIENPFFSLYKHTFHAMLPGSGFGEKTVCLQRGVFQSQPQKMFVWDSWNKDSACSLIGPATLFQRWNIAARHAYGLLTSNSLQALNTGVIKILLVERKATVNRWGSERTSRNILNMEALVSGIRESVILSWKDHSNVRIEIMSVAFEKMTFEKQIQMVSQASIIIGTHGAGLALALHMSIGTKYCCGVIEIFPQGEFFRIRGHGNMLRRTGIKYNRVDVSHTDSKNDGVIVSVQTTATMVDSMLREIVNVPSCIRRNVYENPYLDLPDKLFDT